MQIVGPILIIALIGIVIFMVTAARRQRAALRRLMRRTAQQAKLHYLATDDGTAERLAGDFDRSEFARFSSPSLGRMVPENVIYGPVPEGDICLFTHMSRQTDGQARQWFVAIVDTHHTRKSQGHGARGLIKCCNRTVNHVAQMGGMAEVDFSADPDFALFFDTRAEDIVSARHTLNDGMRREILDTTARLHFPVDLQITGGRIALYPAERNFTPERARDLSELLFAARHLAGILARS